MTVKELIEQLQKFNPEQEVRVEMTDPTDWTYQNPIEYDLRLGEKKDYEEYNDDDFELDEDDCPDYDRVKESSKVVIINGGDC